MSKDRAWHDAFIALGGNVGDVMAAMAKALRAIDDHEDCRVMAVSPVYATAPWGIEDQPEFLNACAKLSTALGPEALLDLLLAQERAAGRQRGQRWGPRTLDLDLLIHGGGAWRSERLTVPHPRMTERAFVLVPLADIAPEIVVQSMPVRHWRDAVDKDGVRLAQTGIEF